jgi:hypothetical protein
MIGCMKRETPSDSVKSEGAEGATRHQGKTNIANQYTPSEISKQVNYLSAWTKSGRRAKWAANLPEKV